MWIPSHNFSSRNSERKTRHWKEPWRCHPIPFWTSARRWPSMVSPWRTDLEQYIDGERGWNMVKQRQSHSNGWLTGQALGCLKMSQVCLCHTFLSFEVWQANHVDVPWSMSNLDGAMRVETQAMSSNKFSSNSAHDTDWMLTFLWESRAFSFECLPPKKKSLDTDRDCTPLEALKISA